MAVSSVVSSLPTPKALSFLYAFCTFDWGKFGQGDGIHIHGVWFVVRARWEMCLGGDLSLA